MRRRSLVILVPLLLAFAGCSPPQSFPEGKTDTTLWHPPIREGTEVPNQYPNGTTREQEAEREDAH